MGKYKESDVLKKVPKKIFSIQEIDQEYPENIDDIINSPITSSTNNNVDPIDSTTDNFINNIQYIGNTFSLAHQDISELLSRVHISENSTIIDNPIRITSNPNLDDIINDNRYLRIEYFRQLFTNIKDYLINNNKSLAFLKIFKNYIIILSNENIDPINDKYVIQISNQITNPNINANQLNEILSIFLIYPKNIYIALALHYELSDKKIINHFFKKIWLKKFTLNQSLGNYIYNKEILLKRKLFFLLINKYNDLVVNLSAKFKSYNYSRLITLGFYKWSDNYNNLSNKKILANQIFIINFIKKKFSINKFKKYNDIKLNFENNIINNNLKKRFFKVLKTTYQSKKNHSNLLNDKLILFNEEQSKLIKRKFLIIIWYKKFHKINQLNYVANDHIKTKFLTQILDISVRKKIENKAIRILNFNRLKFFLIDIWLNQYNSHIKLHSLLDICNNNLQKKFLLNWYTNYITIKNANIIYNNKILKKTLVNWRLKTKYSQFSKNNNRNLQTLSFTLNLWNILFCLNYLLNYYQMNNILRKRLINWRNKFKNTNDLLTVSNNYRDEKIIKTIFKLWIMKFNDIKNIEKLANNKLNLHSFHILKKSVNHKLSIEKIYNENNFSEKIDTRLKENFFKHWFQKSQLKHLLKLKEKFITFNKYKKLKILEKNFNIWYHKNNLYNIYFDDIAEKQYYKNLLQENLNKMIEKKSFYHDLTVEAINNYNDIIVTKQLEIWINRLNHLNYLNEKLQHYEIQKDLILLLKSLKSWTRKYFKLQNYEGMSQTFRKRWDRATLRGLLDLWKSRTNNSPKKVRFNRHLERNNNNTNFFSSTQPLTTPLRGALNQENLTIPGSATFKRNKIEAVKSRYGRAKKAIPSPAKNSKNYDSDIKRRLQKSENSSTLPEPPKLNLNTSTKPQPPTKRTTIDFTNLPQVSKKITSLYTYEEGNEGNSSSNEPDSPTRRG